jgi:hypothetical protein
MRGRAGIKANRNRYRSRTVLDYAFLLPDARGFLGWPLTVVPHASDAISPPADGRVPLFWRRAGWSTGRGHPARYPGSPFSRAAATRNGMGWN